MINSRSLTDLLPAVRLRAEQFLAHCAAAGHDILVTSTYRDHESQAAIYAQGRTTPGRIVTFAKPGDSWHQWRMAFDVVPVVNGKLLWGTSTAEMIVWNDIGDIGEGCGLEWAGRWKRFREFAHFQFTNSLTLAQVQSGMVIV